MSHLLPKHHPAADKYLSANQHDLVKSQIIQNHRRNQRTFRDLPKRNREPKTNVLWLFKMLDIIALTAEDKDENLLN